MVDGREDRDLAPILGMLAGGAPQPAHERVAVGLRRALTLRIFPEDRLPPERQLAEWFGVSRVTIRQALAILRDEGLVVSAQSRRAGTLSLPRSMGTHTSSGQLLSNAHSDIVDILDFRSVIEPTVARLAARHVDDQLLVRLHESVEATRTTQDATSFRRADSEFHLALAQACRNRRLMEAVLVTRAQLLHWRDLLPMPDDVEENVVGHGRIAAAVGAGDEDGAGAAMAAHLRGTLASFVLNVGKLGARAPRVTP